MHTPPGETGDADDVTDPYGTPAPQLLRAWQSGGQAADGEPPARLLHAWQRGDAEHNPVELEIDGVRVMFVVGGGRRPDPARDSAAWRATLSAMREARRKGRR
ncbi:hypothetical protein [Sphaerisporangium sp. TRM90804]|uniref:hypothetical protein n=1 Tax=Sphaerisporangium sp. TRM90804 TaxID=3031113 RepID=UPI0024497D59|nr:hypothetical protein [Sphaerisporangium sp. TRM90804]MDH2424245.1 hypothetical protein [Sphaerisporangium sp. TRM90804]